MRNWNLKNSIYQADMINKALGAEKDLVIRTAFYSVNCNEAIVVYAYDEELDRELKITFFENGDTQFCPIKYTDTNPLKVGV